MTVLDAETNEVVTTLTGIEAPHNVQTGRDTVTTYAVSGHDNTVGAVDTTMPHGLRAAPNGSVIAVANTAAQTVDLLDQETDVAVAAVPVAGNPLQVAVDADGQFAYATIAGPASIVKVDLRSREVIGTVAVSASPVQIFLTPDGRTIVSAD